MPQLDDNWITVKEAATISNYDPAHISRWAKNGKFLAKKRGRSWLIDYPSLKSFLSTNQQEARINRVKLSLERKDELQNGSRSNSFSLVDLEAVMLTLVLLFTGFLSGAIVYGYLNNGSNVSDVRLGLAYIVEQIEISVPLVNLASVVSALSK